MGLFSKFPDKDSPTDGGSPGTSSSKWLLYICLMIIVLGLIGAGSYFLIEQKP